MNRNYLRTFKKIVNRYILNVIQADTFPFVLTIFITSKCNQYDICDSCWRLATTRNNSDISMTKIKEITTLKIPIVMLSGGEPTEHPDFQKIVQTLVNSNIKTYILTNGINLQTLLKSDLNTNFVRVILSCKQCYTQSQIEQTLNSALQLKKSGAKVYLNIPLDLEKDSLSYFNSIASLLETVDRIYLTKLIKDSCGLITMDQAEILSRTAHTLNKRHNKKVIYMTNYPKHVRFLCKLLSWVMNESFDPCSGYPFKASMDEEGNLYTCLRREGDCHESN